MKKRHSRPPSVHSGLGPLVPWGVVGLRSNSGSWNFFQDWLWGHFFWIPKDQFGPMKWSSKTYGPHCVKPQYWHAFWHLVHIFATISPIWMKFQLAHFFCKSLIISILSRPKRPFKGQLVDLLAFVPKMLFISILDLLKSYQNLKKKFKNFGIKASSLWFNSNLCNQFSQ